MIPAYKLYAVWVSQFETCQKRYSLNAEQSTVDIVTYHIVCQLKCTGHIVSGHTKEKVVRMWRITTYSKYFHKIVELAWDLINYNDA